MTPDKPLKIVDMVKQITSKKNKRIDYKEKLRRRRGQAKCELVIDFNENEFNDESDEDPEIFER